LLPGVASSARKEAEDMMVCIPTHVRAAPEDRELARAWCALLLTLRSRGLTDGSDVAQVNRGARWRYLYSTPYVCERGQIIYLHLFGHDCHPETNTPLTIRIRSERSWWPDDDAEILSPPRSQRTGSLRLVS
jgi:hypothetical protein